MPINKETLNKRLHSALSRYDSKPVDDNNEVVPLPDEADAFRFNFTKDGENYGTVFATLDDTNQLTIWYDDAVMSSPDSKTPGLDYDDTFTGLLKYMKRWAMNNQLKFDTDNKDHLGNEMARRKRMKEKEKISEGYYPIGKKASYSDAVPNVKIILQHTKVMQEGEQRFRHIEKIFVENTQGERFLVPTTKPGLARVFARHIAEGGTPYDERAGHIQSLVEEYSKMAGFVRATRNGQFNESAQQLVQEGVNHYVKLRESLSKMTGHRGYTAYFENWTPALMEDDSDTNNINELFVQETLDPRIESVMPILSRLHKQVSEMKEVDELSEWADTIISEKMVMGADSDASASGTVFNEESLDDLEEATDLKSIPDESIEESGLQAYLGNKKYGEKGMDALRKAGREHASKEKMAKIRAKYDKLDEVEMEEGLGDVAKKVGGAIKKAAGKAMDVVAPGDEELLKQLQKSAGVRGMNHGKPSMAHSEVEKKVDEDLGPEQKRVGQLGPTEKVKNNNIGKLVGANENFINMAPQAVAEGQEELEELKRLLGEGWKGELAAGTAGGIAGSLAGDAIAGPMGGVVGGALGGTAGGMIGRELTKEEQIDEIAPLVGAGIAAGARALVPLLSKIGPALGRMASSASKAAAPVAQKGAQAAAQTAGQATRAGAEIAAKNAVPIGIGAGAYSAITDLAQGITGGVGEVYGDVKSAAAAIGGKLGDAVDSNTIMALAAAAVKYALPIGILLALVYGGKKLIDKVTSESAMMEGQEDLDAILRIVRQ